jgi:hypothetical protein
MGKTQPANELLIENGFRQLSSQTEAKASRKDIARVHLPNTQFSIAMLCSKSRD